MRPAPRCLLAFVAACLAGCEPAPPREQLDAHALHVQLQLLSSLAGEAVLLTQELEADHLNAAFGWVHQQGLAEETSRAASALAQPAPASLRTAQQEAMLVAAALQTQLTRVAGVQHDPGELQALRALFGQLRQRARALENAS